MNRTWTSQETEILKHKYPIYGAVYCAKILGFSTRRIRHRVYHLGLTKKILSNKKPCLHCGKVKAFSEFSKNKTGQFGLQPKCKKCRAKWESERKKNDKDYRLEHTIRNRIRMAIKKEVKSGSSLELLGCSIDFLKKYISKKFTVGMKWENHGLWHLDHIIPCCQFDLSKPEQQRKCFHYTNLQPLWAKDNLSKAKKLV